MVGSQQIILSEPKSMMGMCEPLIIVIAMLDNPTPILKTDLFVNIAGGLTHPDLLGHDPNQVLYGDTTVSPPCMGHSDFISGRIRFHGL